MNLADPPAGKAGSGWRARLELGYECRDGTTRLTSRRHTGPLVVQKPFYPEGPEVCHSVVLHPPGGIAGGDLLELDVTVSGRARSLITTPGAAKWYRSAGPTAEQVVRLQVGEGASLEWLPQENIVFDRSRVHMRTLVNLAQGAHYIGWDVTRLGRTASGERFDAGELRSRTEILRAGRRLWGDYARFEGGAGLLQSPAGLAGYPIMGTMLAAGVDIERELLDTCRAVASEGDARFGVTTLPGVLAARFLGHSTEAARAYFVALWRLLRPALIGREASVPRIWAT
ncbi:MAG TPA: urease accessory protein UreD [Burkholderiales bacterium]|nr:urease accessory protein UreD [Burkholderiales bacterium]